MAYGLWLRIERERIAKTWSKMDLFNALKSHLGDGPAIARSTLDNLRDSSRPPQPRIVNALAAVLDIEEDEAARLAGLVPDTDPDLDVREAIRRSGELLDDEKRALLDLVDLLVQRRRPTDQRSQSA